MWQDYVISGIGLAFGFMLIPQIGSSWYGRHVNRWSAGLTASGLLVMGVCFWTLGLWLSALAEVITASSWTVLFILATCARRREDKERWVGRVKKEKKP